VLGQESWPESTDERLFARVIGREPYGVIVIVDPQTGETHGQLRSLSLMRALGVRRFSFANGWRGLDLVPYDWVRIASDTTHDELVDAFPICQVVSQAMEDNSDGDATGKLFRAWQDAGPDALLVLVVDTDTFARKLDPQVRSFVDEHELPMPLPYEPLARKYIRQVHLAPGQPIVSHNLAWHGLSAWRRANEPVQQLEDVLNIGQHRSDSPLWDLYAHLCELAGDGADTEKVRDGARHWIDNQITRASSQLVLWVQRFSFDPGQVRRRQASVGRRGS
jgi:hypothetical protein